MQDSLKLADSPEAAYRDGKEFPNYVEMYTANLQSGKMQLGKTDLKGLDSSAAGISHEEVLVRWLRLRSCNQVDVFIDTEKVDNELQGLMDDLKRARAPAAHLTAYWTKRLAEMKDGGVDKKIIEYFKNDTEKDLLYRGYVDTESKIGSKSSKKPKFLLFLFMAILGAFAMGAIGVFGLSTVLSGAVGAVAGVAVGMGAGMVMGGGGSSGTEVMDKLIKDFPSPIIETRLVEKKSCILGLFWCMKHYKILHWPAFSNAKGIDSAFPFVKKEERTCEQTADRAASLPGTNPNSCAGMIKGTQCARTFYRPIADTAIKDNAAFAPWGEIMKDKTLMDPIFPEFFSTEGMDDDFRWVNTFNQGFKAGCASVASKDGAQKADKLKFLPDLSRYFENNLAFKPAYQFGQARIDSYKDAVKRYALCKNLKDCGAKMYDGDHPNPRGFLDIVEDEQQAELFANYVYQIHFKWRHMSSNTGIGYPLAYLENYYLALQYNVRLLTTLSIRRGIEFDDAYNRYAEDLGIRRTNYQDTSGTYGVTLGEETARPKVELSTFFRDVRQFGAIMGTGFDGVAGSTSVTTRDSVKGSSVTGGRLGNSASLNAVRRLASRIEADNLNAKNFANATKNNSSAVGRTANASRFMKAVNSPTAMMPSFANQSDKTNYSGIGGSLTKQDGSLVASNARPSEIGAVDTSNRPNSGAALMKSGGLGTEGADEANGGAKGSYGAGVAAETDKELDDAARLTGMNSGDVKEMLDGSESERRKLQGTEDDSLFNKVSKAYMRNLDRVLIRKKGPEKVGQDLKPKTADEKEKSEIKSIFNQ